MTAPDRGEQLSMHWTERTRVASFGDPEYGL